MFARATRIEGILDYVDALTDVIRAELMPDVTRMTGCKGFFIFEDREDGELMLLTLWQTMDDLDRSDVETERLKSQKLRITSNDSLKVTRYEVAESRVDTHWLV